MLTPDQRNAAKTRAQARIDEATALLWDGALTELEWSSQVSDALAAAYLLDDDPRWQSGFDGDARLWREARELILDPIVRDGTFLDVGSATGHLIESLAIWAEERGRDLTLYGLELSPQLVAAARRRLPSLADRLFEGNVVTWKPALQFTYVHTGLEYLPIGRRPYLIQRLLALYVEPGGRLITGPVPAEELEAQQELFRIAGVSSSHTVKRIDSKGKTRALVWCERARTDLAAA